VLDELVAAGFDLFATATNHALDYSISGLVHTIGALEARGLSFAGVGRNLEDARRTASQWRCDDGAVAAPQSARPRRPAIRHFTYMPGPFSSLTGR
jgi:poly-gamma-glutamate capsule biosynthesis protein CapA/YwtB (metallophosphatase superfamily)